MSSDLHAKKYLVIDDFFDFRLIMKKMIESFGTKDVDDADSGEKAIELMRRKAYDIILCDYNLGEGKKDGQQILEEVKHHGLIKYSSIFIMVTAENTMPMVMGAVENQPDDYLIKPVTKAVLTRRIENLLAKKADFEDIEKAMQKKEYSLAISLCDEHVKNNRKNMLEFLRLKSNIYITLGRYAESAAVCEEVLSMREILWAKMGVGKVQFLTGAYLKARDTFQAIIDENKSFMEAYDWLAKTFEELGSLEEAQRVLLNATDISPKAILRHQSIGKISFKLRDFGTAEDAYKSAIEIGKNSCYKSPAEYTGLAKSLMKTDSSEEALSILVNAREEFKGNREAIFETAVAEGVIFKETNREEDAKKAIQEASKLMGSISGNVSVSTTMDLAKVCFELGEKERGLKLVQSVVENNHDNDLIIKQVQEVFKEVKLEEEGALIIKSTRDKIVKLNNQGVHLVDEGKVEEAIEYFDKAASGLPDSKIINANAARAYMEYMKIKGTNDHHLYQASQYLDRVKRIDPSYDKYPMLLAMYETLLVSKKTATT